MKKENIRNKHEEKDWNGLQETAVMNEEGNAPGHTRPAQTSCCNGPCHPFHRFSQIPNSYGTRVAQCKVAPFKGGECLVFPGSGGSQRGLEQADLDFFCVAQILLGRGQSRNGTSISCRQAVLQLERISALLKTWHRCLKIMARAVSAWVFL